LSAAIVSGFRRWAQEASTVDIVAIGIGLLFGALVSAALALPLSFMPEPAGTFLPLFAAVVICGFAVAIAIIRKRDLIVPWMRVRTPKAPTASPVNDETKPEQASVARALILDTNVIIDGRLNEIVQTGFLDAQLLLPRFVLDELQRIADAEDPLRRARGRRGLDSMNRLRADYPAMVEVVDDLVPEEREVDAKLVRLARSRRASILTNDFNLNKVARLQDVRVLNLNELTGALRPLVLPGEELSLKVVQEGREAGQGVGFLDDGTMVVVDGGRTLVGSQVAVTVTRMLQTGAGRMVFATPKHAVPV
jgi:uncharacterized protein YacL